MLRRTRSTTSCAAAPLIVSAARTALGSFGGGLSGVPAPQLGALAIRGCLDRAGEGVDQHVDEAYMGLVLSAGVGQAPARQAVCATTLHGGASKPNLPWSTPCTTVNKVCASGMKAVMLASSGISSGMNHCVVAGGMENMSMAPFCVASTARHSGLKFGHSQLKDVVLHDGLWDAFDDHPMGMAAEHCATKHAISRRHQDEYAVMSYKRAQAAVEDGRFDAEIVPVPVKTGQFQRDEEPFKVKFDKIDSLRPAFTEQGSVTAANASSINDGAAAMLLCSSAFAADHGLTGRARILAVADAAQEPIEFTTAPAKAIPIALERAGLSIQDVDRWEINEAFSAVAIVNQRLLNLDMDRINVNGGAVALGHPIGASGCRILVTLLHALEQCDGSIGVAAICNGGGGASAVVIQRV